MARFLGIGRGSRTRTRAAASWDAAAAAVGIPPAGAPNPATSATTNGGSRAAGWDRAARAAGVATPRQRPAPDAARVAGEVRASHVSDAPARTSHGRGS
jgi:hypothetical protein